MKKITLREWVAFGLLALFFAGAWFKFGYPRLSCVDLSVDRGQALSIAQNYLASLKVDTRDYRKAVVFKSDAGSDCYLQKTLGINGQRDFIKKYNYDLFSWEVRFFRPYQKEEYSIEISPQTSQVIGFVHAIEEVAARPLIEKDAARTLAEDFLRRNFGIDFADYDFHEEKTKRYELRTDYAFSWERKGARIPWGNDAGAAKLLLGATVSGEEVRGFYRGALDLPEKFGRQIAKEAVLGDYLYTIHFLALTFILGCSIIILLKRKDSVLMPACRNFFWLAALVIIALNLFSWFNDFQSLLAVYPTTSSFSAFFGIYLVKVLISLTIFTVLIILPGVAGEFLRREAFPDKQYSSFWHFLRASFLSRALARGVLFGYLCFMVFLGLQAIIFRMGQRYLGVWETWSSLTQFSSAYVPFFTAFVIGITAGFQEEVIFRLFGVSWAKKYLKNTLLAVIFAALIWGIGHSQYAVYPVWFRSIEVTILGIVFGFVFLRYGIIPVIVAHYLFNVFLGVSPYLFGKSSLYLFSGALFILLLPLFLAAKAYFANHPDQEEPAAEILSENQRYNLEVLIDFVSRKKLAGLGSDQLREELLRHDWDALLVTLAIKEVYKQ
ncbi:MAG: type II CAAX endopeptidase family protein [Candidatus Omnitrophica bacterium]|nr:type II CAAX endopeptidase family protein [Candidatus Omnitrophota bacterium]